MTEQPRRIEYMRLEDVTPNEGNPKSHDLDIIGESVHRFGFIEPITLDERTGKLISGHGRLETLQAAEMGGLPLPQGLQTDAKGKWLVPVSRGWSSRNDAEAGAVLVALNRTVELGGWDDAALAAILNELAESEDLQGTGYDLQDLDSLSHSIDMAEQNSLGPETDQYQEGHESGELSKGRFESSIDLIFSISNPYATCALYAYSHGWNPGVITSTASRARKYVQSHPAAKPIMFMDNEWHGYNHSEHIQALSEFKPKYATVRDLLTREQAKEAGVEFFTVEETLRMAEEVAQHAENVILIPKYDCLDKLPREINGKRVVLGYSVHSSYGGTPLRAERFKGWPVHLLGGSWKKQRALISILKEDVVSLDNNHMYMVGRYGQVCLGNGKTSNSADLLDILPKNTLNISVILSLTYIYQEICKIFSVKEIQEESVPMSDLIRLDENEIMEEN